MTCNGEFRYIGIGQEGKNLAAAPTNVRLYAKSTSSLTFAWDDTNAARTYTVQCADAPSEDAELMAQYTYTWTTKSTSDKWPYDYPTRMTFLGLMKGGDRSVGSEENLIRPGKTYYFRVRGGGANDEAKWSEWISATPETRTAPAGEIFYEGFDRACVGGGDWLNQAACARTKNDNTQTSIWKLQWDTAVKAAVTTYGNYYTAANFNAEVYKWIGYTRIWDRGTGKGDIQPCPGYTKCGNGSNVGAFRILALGAEKLSAEGDAVTLTFKATPWSEVTTGAGYTMDNKLVDVYVNDAVVAADVRITDSDAADGDPAVLTDMVWKEVVVEIPNLKPEDTITIMGKTNEAKAGKGRFFIDDVSIVKK
ncbi:fibronectin type III domain-containing protein [Alistipes communis]|uniref:fibronectin type III domain-containing protein n=1 Tax=Alistipes communis TaxID=2585118 RepID=UPI001D087615|nr:fibronectin type III domain-containing protein [Alistipes communis]MCB6995714.1 fibronectin type III domain-containing protein [Alistipes communis]